MRSCLRQSRGFSLVELLVALSILGVVATVVVPKFLNLKNQAVSEAAQQVQSQLNTTYANWKASGGVVDTTNGPVRSSDMLGVLLSNTKQSSVTTSTGGRITETDLASLVRISDPGGLQAVLPPIGSSAPQEAVVENGVTIMFNSSMANSGNGITSPFITTASPSLSTGVVWKKVFDGNGVLLTTIQNSVNLNGGGNSFSFPIPAVPNSSGVVYCKASSGVNGLLYYSTGNQSGMVIPFTDTLYTY
jgi:prepilin-type N-terminal cleavage/methylation domain-containing protein